MALLAAGSPLVAGGAAPTMANEHIKATRSFFWKQKTVEVGQIVEVPAWFAAEAVYANKAVRVPKPAPVVEPVEAEAVEAPAAPAPKRRTKDAGE